MSNRLTNTPDGRRRYATDYVLPPMAGGAPDSSDDQTDQSSDDGQEEEGPGTVNITHTTVCVTSYLDAWGQSWGCLRFRNGPFPAQGSTIDVAYIEISVVAGADDANFDIYAEDGAAPLTIVVANFNITGRTRTTAFAPWSADDLGALWKRSPSIVSVIQELATDYNIETIVLILKPIQGTFKHISFRAWDTSGNVSGAKLHLEWTEAGIGADEMMAAIGPAGGGGGGGNAVICQVPSRAEGASALVEPLGPGAPMGDAFGEAGEAVGVTHVLPARVVSY